MIMRFLALCVFFFQEYHELRVLPEVPRQETPPESHKAEIDQFLTLDEIYETIPECYESVNGERKSEIETENADRIVSITSISMIDPQSEIVLNRLTRNIIREKAQSIKDGRMDHSDENNPLQVTHQFKEGSIGVDSFNGSTNDLLMEDRSLSENDIANQHTRMSHSNSADDFHDRSTQILVSADVHSSLENTFQLGDRFIGNLCLKAPSSIHVNEQNRAVESTIDHKEDDVIDASCVAIHHEYFIEEHICQSADDKCATITKGIANRHNPEDIISKDSKISDRIPSIRNNERCEIDKELKSDCHVMISCSPDRSDICNVCIQHEYFPPRVILQPHSKCPDLSFRDQDEAQIRQTRMLDHYAELGHERTSETNTSGSTHLYELERQEQRPNVDEFGYTLSSKTRRDSP